MLDTLLGDIREFVDELKQLLDPEEVKEGLVERTLLVRSGQLLELDLASGGAVDISGWEREELAVKVSIGGRGSKGCEVDISKTADGVRIYGHNPQRRIIFSNNHRYSIKVPLRFDLQIKSSGGNIRMANVEGRIKGKTMGGTIDLKNLKGEVSLKTMGGNISLKDSEVNGKLETLGGNIRVENVEGNVAGVSAGGNVLYR